jgi:hypothetical protein
MYSIIKPFLSWVQSDTSKYCNNKYGLCTIHAVLLLWDLYPKLWVPHMVSFSFSVVLRVYKLCGLGYLSPIVLIVCD